MSDEFDPNKTEEPTPRRREKAREEGQVVFSSDLTSGLMLLALGGACLFAGPAYGERLQLVLREGILNLNGSDWGTTTTLLSARWLLSQLALLAGGICLGAMVLNVGVAQIQSGFTLTGKPLTPNWGKLSPVKGFQRMWSLDAGMRGVLGTLKLTASLTVATVFVWGWGTSIRAGSRGELAQSVQFSWSIAGWLLLALAGVTIVFGLSDYVFRFFRNELKLRMTKQEVKEEIKQDQGDPHVRARIRKLQKDSAERATLRQVPQATVVVTNPTHFAVAIKYESGRMKAPRVIAKGSGAFAKRIIATAREHGVPVLERKPLARALYALAAVGKEIPLEFYHAVAEILAHVYRLKHST